MKIAYFTPLPPQKSGIAIYNAQLLPYLAQLADLTLFTDQPQETDEALQQQFVVRDSHSFAGPLAEGFDVCLYQMGNNIHYHSQIYKMLRRFPGIVTLHDINLHSFYGELLMKQGQFAAYTREMAFAYDQTGVAHARRTRFEGSTYDVARFPLFERIVQGSLGTIVHNNYSKRLVSKNCPQAVVTHINLHQVPLTDQLLSQAEAKTRLGYQPDDILLASFGYISPSKHIDVVLQALASLRNQKPIPKVHYALVGQPVEGYNVQSLLRQLGLEEIVRLVGYADESLFQTYVAAVDIGINLRYPTHGETSSTLLTLMAAAKPALVSNVDAFAELPDDICLKIGVGAGEEAQIEDALSQLITNEAKRQALGQKAFEFVSQTCHPLTVAQAYITFARHIISSTG